MREHKFRAWDKKEKKWLNDFDFAITGEGEVYLYKQGFSEDGYIQLSEDIDIFQYIERKNKNSKEMCEGDIVKWINNFGEENIGWIRYTKAVAGFYVVLIKGSYIPFYTGSEQNFGWSDLRVIGTVCENPELLGKKEEDIFIRELKEK